MYTAISRSVGWVVLVVLSREENAMGRLLKTGSEMDKTRAGKMMAAVAKAQNYSSQQL